MSKELAKILKERRLELGLKARVVARRLGIGHTTLWIWERGEDPRNGRPATPSIEYIYKLADIYGLSKRVLLSLAGSSKGLDLIQSAVIPSEVPVEDNTGISLSYPNPLINRLIKLYEDDLITPESKQLIERQLQPLMDWIDQHGRREK